MEEAHFNHPDIQVINLKCFGVTSRDRSVSQKIHQLTQILKDHLYTYIDKFNINFLLVENALTIPMNIPLGIALTQVIAETNIPTVAHHHDFCWERDRFLVNAGSDYLNMAFPPNLPSIMRHIVINSYADEQLSFRTGISAHVAPNVMDFENPPPPPDDYTLDVRQILGIEDDELLTDGEGRCNPPVLTYSRNCLDLFYDGCFQAVSKEQQLLSIHFRLIHHLY